MTDELSTQVAAVGALAEPARWALYRVVAAASEPVSREQAAAAAALPLHSAKFHLDRLVDEGLLDVEYRRLTGRTGPGAGRPAKLYRRAHRQVSITLPERRYDLAGDLLAAAVERSMRDQSPVAEAVQAVAHAAGVRLARERASQASAEESDDLGTVVSTLSALAYEPQVVDGDVCLANCPFDQLAAQHTELVCGMNLSFVRGLLDGLETQGLVARLEPAPDLCCVKITR